MQFNRNNFPNSLQNEPSVEPDPQGQPVRDNRMTTAQRPPEVPLDQAPWQAAFKLAPNVRFTRTPESAIPKRTRNELSPLAPEERKPAAESRLVEPLDMAKPQAAAETLAPELLVNALQGAAHAMQQPVANQQPVQPKVRPQPSPRALIVKRARPNYQPEEAELKADVAPVEAPAPVAEAVQPSAPQSPEVSVQPELAPPMTAKPETSLPWLSDFAFFEGDFAVADVAVTSAPVATPFLPRRPAEVIRQPRPALQNSIVSLYREVRRAEPQKTVAASEPIPAPQVSAAEPVAPYVAVANQLTISNTVSFNWTTVWQGAHSLDDLPLIAEATSQAMEIAAESQIAAPVPEVVFEPPVAQVAQPHRTIVPISSRPTITLPGLDDHRTVRPSDENYEFPPISLLQQPYGQQTEALQPDALQQSAGLLESILEDFGVKGEIIDVRPGPVVTLYEFEPAPGVKSSRVIGLADDIARSMSALSARVAVVPGRNVIGIELPNAVREMVFFRELIECEDYWETKHRLPLCLGKTIGGEPVIAELAKMPHLLVAGTTGSGKSVAINTMILSLLYRLRPEECRMIMIDPKMLELSVYDGIPHLLTPVVTDPKKAVLALKWAVREMEDRYRKMSRLGVRNIDGYNQRAAQAREKGETITVSVQTGFDRHSGEIVYEDQELDLSPMPYIVVIVDEMADLMMVAGKEIEGAIQRLAQMARAAGIHLIMATQRPSVDVITGTIKANFPTRISFQVTSKIDSRTILGEQGAEHLLGQGDMLHMAGGGRIMRVHGPFVSDAEVEHVVTHLKAQGRPDYLGTVTEDESEIEAEAEEEGAVFDRTNMGAEEGDDLYEKAIKVVMKDRKCSTSYIQRRLSIGYNRAASLVERMEQEGLVGPANHVGKREIISGRTPGSDEG
ncbi:DNA translocase FtsK [Rhizobium rhizoryzae]|uniref:S-DNA-T family DNA segregation ATPase FtsK/SpoIIIE n=1 Tax=Rhizobium rhizoryzae TaxID=451876 RepID=A0A7W6PSI4_9HYPH|nr:S-DNA-T family DNA segregation ATPase FtsK/SpoIIIE [Rhizobium rhizoryzae]